VGWPESSNGITGSSDVTVGPEESTLSVGAVVAGAGVDAGANDVSSEATSLMVGAEVGVGGGGGDTGSGFKELEEGCIIALGVASWSKSGSVETGKLTPVTGSTASGFKFGATVIAGSDADCDTSLCWCPKSIPTPCYANELGRLTIVHRSALMYSSIVAEPPLEAIAE
jgi:hypothetical protein